MSDTFTVLGSGSWGTAVALLLAQKPNRRVRLWSARPESAAEMRRDRENKRLLPGVPIPPEIELHDDPAAALADATLAIAAVPTIYLRGTIERLRSAWPKHLAVVSLTKGVELGTFLRPTEIWRHALGVEQVAALSGPSHAEEVSRGRPTSLVVASSDATFAAAVQRAISTERFRLYASSDVVGVELAGALKNVIGIAAGICDGLGLGDNAKSALMTRGLAEMTRFGVANGAEPGTFAGLAGFGDLVTTCVSPHGRNRKVGERLGRGETLADILAGMAMIAEGVTTARSVDDRARQLGLPLPITREVRAVLDEGKSPLAAVQDLMNRPLGWEELAR